MNNVTIVGNLVDDVELRFTPSGVALGRVNVAVNKRYQKGGEWVEETSFFRGTVWREQAEHAASSLHKGDRVIVSGQLQQQSWETTEGDKRSAVNINVQAIGPSLQYATATVVKAAPKQAQSAVAPPPLQSVATPQQQGGHYPPDEAPF